MTFEDIIIEDVTVKDCGCEFVHKSNEFGKSHIENDFCSEHLPIKKKEFNDKIKFIEDMRKEYKKKPTNELIRKIFDLEYQLHKESNMEDIYSKGINFNDKIFCCCCDKTIERNNIPRHIKSLDHIKHLPQKNYETYKQIKEHLMKNPINAKLINRPTFDFETGKLTKENIEYQEKNNLYAQNRKINGTIVTNFVKTMRKDNKFKKLISELENELKISNLGTCNSRPQWIVDKNLYGVYGQFIDYLCRHYICSKLGKTFVDRRAEKTQIHLMNEIFSDFDSDSDITIDDKIIQLNKSHAIVCKNNKTKEIIDHILNISISHSISFHRNSDRRYIGVKNDKISDKMFNDITKYLDKKIQNKKPVLCNPDVSLKHIKLQGDADIIIEDELIDIKTSNHDGKYFKHFYQLIIYACIYNFNTGIKLNKITIYNPILNIESSISLADWHNEKKLIDLFEEHIEFRKIDTIGEIEYMYRRFWPRQYILNNQLNTFDKIFWKKNNVEKSKNVVEV